VIPRFPCFATGNPAAAATIPAAVEIFTIGRPPPPVPQQSPTLLPPHLPVTPAAFALAKKARALPAPRALDLGTGSGCLAIVLAKLVPALFVTAVDLSRDALDIARQNAQRNKVDTRVQFLCGDLFHPLKEEHKFDIVVSNPPYIPSADIAGLEPTVRDFEPKSALDGGADGLDFYRRIFEGAPQHLQPQGRVMVEVGIDQAEAVASLAREKGFVQVAIVADMAKVPRVVVARLG
jgi:release factor glutamine methyltransferase